MNIFSLINKNKSKKTKKVGVCNPSEFFIFKKLKGSELTLNYLLSFGFYVFLYVYVLTVFVLIFPKI